MPAHEVITSNSLATGGLKPDITLLLGIDSSAGMARTRKRGAQDRMELSGDGFHERVSQAFTLFGTAEWQKEHPECGEIFTIDASGSEGDGAALILQKISARWPDRFEK